MWLQTFQIIFLMTRIFIICAYPSTILIRTTCSIFFPEAISFIWKSSRRLFFLSLFIDLAGISRSVTVCLAYLMYSLHSTLEEAFDLLLKQNGTIAPNFHFMATLTCWERQLLHGNEVQPLIPKDAHNKKNSLSREDLRLSWFFTFFIVFK